MAGVWKALGQSGSIEVASRSGAESRMACGIVVGVQQCLDSLPQYRVSSERLIEVRRPLGRVFLKCVDEDIAFVHGGLRISGGGIASPQCDVRERIAQEISSFVIIRRNIDVIPEFGLEPGTGVGPGKVGCPGRDAQHFRGLGDRQAGEVAELDQLGGSGVYFASLSALIEGEQVVGLLSGSWAAIWSRSTLRGLGLRRA